MFDVQRCEGDAVLSDQRAARYIRDEADNLIESNGACSQRALGWKSHE